MTNNGDAVEISIKERVEGAKVPRATECCILKVPFNIRRHNEEAYTPKVVSIGPVHNRHRRLQDMEHKLYYCNSFLQRTRTTFERLIHEIEDMEPEFRRCYSHTTLNFSKEQLVNIMLVDCAFILELFCRRFYTEVEDMRLSTPSWNRSIKLDLLLLENQVPFFVLERLFDLSIPSWDPHSPQFLALTFNYFEEFNRSNLNIRDINISIRHFTDLIRTFFLQDPLPPMIHDQPMKHLPSATELSEAGLRFKVRETESCLLKLDFSGRVLEIPQLVVDDWTETLFRNMVALEECLCLYPHKAYITEYVNFLDFLVNTNRDVDILVQARVFVHYLPNTDSVATMIKGLTKDITSNALPSHFFSLYVKLSAFYNNPRRKLESTLRRWKTAASSAALIILILTIVQTVCSILQVIHQ